MLPIFTQALQQPTATAILDANGSYTYGELWESSTQMALQLLDGKQDLNEARVAFMVSPGFHYVATLWGIWKAGGIAVPLCLSYPLPSLRYVIEDTQAALLVADAPHVGILEGYAQENGIPLLPAVLAITQALPSTALPIIDLSRGALLLYTSGTTSLPKGVLSTHANLTSQIGTLVEAWQWSSADHTLCLLPLHHVHGIINVVSSALWAGARLQFLHPFDAKQVLDLFLEGKITVFMAVPTIYFKLIAEIDSYSELRKKELFDCMSAFRLMVSGSAALPVSVMDTWRQVSGHTLLERYGMTEIGMAISNPYQGDRRAGYIGIPLPQVEVRLVDEQMQQVPAASPGEIQIKGPSVFHSYWGKPEATEKSFTTDGWFKTGDIAVLEQGYYRILGRDSVDIIKSGGYKISALEIEEVLRTHPQVSDCAVVGLPDPEWGERVAAAIVITGELTVPVLTQWMRELLPGYKTPRTFLLLNELPRNAMGKVVKNDLKTLFS